MNRNSISDDTHCSICECLWVDHDFGVPEPYCPGPVVNQEAGRKAKEERDAYKLKNISLEPESVRQSVARRMKIWEEADARLMAEKQSKGFFKKLIALIKKWSR